VSKLLKIAKHTRQLILDFAEYKGLHYRYPTPDEHLACWCAIASRVLALKLNAAGINARVVIGHFDEDGDHRDAGTPWEASCNHAWVQTDTNIVDLTASQFDWDIAPILITSLTDKRFDGKSDLRSENWKTWMEQAPTPGKIRAILKYERDGWTFGGILY
jgi:hypothetical protein